MKLKTYNSEAERTALTGVIIDNNVCASVAAKWNGNNFASKWSNIIAGWCVQHFGKYGQAPGRGIQLICEQWQQNNKTDDATVKLIEKYLDYISKEHEKNEAFNYKQVIDIAGKHFEEVIIRTAHEEAAAHIEAGEFDKAREKMSLAPIVELGASKPTHPLNDKEHVRQTFANETIDQLVEYPGAIGKLFYGRFEREGFVAFVAPEKTGKTTWLVDIAYRAMTQRRRVAFFEIGDESEKEISLRFYQRTAKQPYRSDDGRWPYSVKKPLRISKIYGEDELPVIASEIKTFTEPLKFRSAWAACEALMTNKVRSKESYLNMTVHPAMSIGVTDIRDKVLCWGREGWGADLIVIDYADNLARPKGKYDKSQDMTTTNWKLLRSLAQETHTLVVTATQARRSTYSGKGFTMEDISDDKNKNGQVTAAFGISATAEEKEHGLLRINCLNARVRRFNPKKYVYCATCLPLCNPCVKSVDKIPRGKRGESEGS